MNPEPLSSHADFPTTTPDAFAREHGLSKIRVMRAIERGDLPGFRLTRGHYRITKRLVTPEMIDALKAKHARHVETQERQFVYFIRAEAGPIKIGVSVDPQARCNELRVSHYAELTLLSAVPGGPLLERALHQQFKHLHMRGEWFRGETELLDEIAKLSASAARSCEERMCNDNA